MPDDLTICEGESVELDAMATGTGELTFSWNEGSGETGTSITVTPLSSFVYQVTVLDSRGCQLTESISITVIEEVSVFASPDSTILQGESTMLFTNLPSTSEFSWTPNDETISNPTVGNPIVDPLTTTDYCVTVTDDQNGCVTTDCVTIKVIQDVNIPNAFSPNGDGINDYFTIPDLGDLCNEVSYFKIFNRWGEEVYNYLSASSTAGWDGRIQFANTEAPIGTYVYLIKLDCNEGERVFSSDVILLR